MRIMLKLLTLSMTPVTNSTGTNNWLLKFGPRLSGENFLAQKSVASTMYETWSCSLPPANEVCEGYVFTGVCLSTGVCIQRGGLHLGGWADPPPIGYYGTRSTSGRYASYWNAFLLQSAVAYHPSVWEALILLADSPRVQNPNLVLSIWNQFHLRILYLEHKIVPATTVTLSKDP